MGRGAWSVQSLYLAVVVGFPGLGCGDQAVDILQDSFSRLVLWVRSCPVRPSLTRTTTRGVVSRSCSRESRSCFSTTTTAHRCGSYRGLTGFNCFLGYSVTAAGVVTVIGHSSAADAAASCLSRLTAAVRLCMRSMTLSIELLSSSGSSKGDLWPGVTCSDFFLGPPPVVSRLSLSRIYSPGRSPSSQLLQELLQSPPVAGLTRKTRCQQQPLR